jgi:hypothetical protein
MNKSKISGYSLLELLIVIGIMAVIAAFAIPAYQNYIERANLAEAKQQMLSFRQAVEAQKLVNPRASLADILRDTTNVPALNSTQKYTFSRMVENKKMYLQAVPKISGHKYGIWIDSDSSVYRCKGLTGSATATKPSNCEAF